MKRLTRIILVNWYLFEAVEWEIEGHAALIGKNGSGKSSLIDAIQLVLLGGHRSDWRPNAKADKQRTRDVRSYVLGLIKEEAAVADSALYQPRPDALCRICLVFTDEVTGEAVSVGTAITARKAESQAEFEGFFIAEGCALRLRDFLVTVDQLEVPAPYTALRAVLRHRTGGHGLYIFPHQPGDFVKQLLASLGAFKRPPALDKFRRAFKQSIYMSGLEGTVSDFVRTSILDNKPIKLEQMRESIASYHNKQEAVRKTKGQIAKLEVIHAALTRAHRVGLLRAGYSWCAAELRFQDAEVQRGALVEKLEELARRYSAKRKSKRELSAEIEHLDTELREVRRTLSNDNAQSQKDLLCERLEVARGEVTRIKSDLTRARECLSYASEVLQYRQELEPKTIGALNDVVRVCATICDAWPEDARAVDTAVATICGELPSVQTRAESARDEALIATERVRAELSDLEARIKRVAEGSSDFSHNTNALIEVLAEEGITAVPVCELVEVTEPDWQPAIEAYLRSNTEALIVPPGQAERATEIYRRLKKHVYGAIVVNTRRVEQYRDTYEVGTAPTLINGSDRLAVGYIQRLLRGIRLREETGKLISEDRALSRDGMYVRQAGSQRLRLPDVPTLGRSAREVRLKHFRDQGERLAAELIGLSKPHQRQDGLAKVATRLIHKLDNYPSVAHLVRALSGAEGMANELVAQIAAIDTSHLEHLKSRETSLNETLQEAHTLRMRCAGDLGAIRSEFRTSNAERHRLDRQVPLLADRRRECEGDPDFDAARATALCEELEAGLEAETPEEFDVMIKKADDRARDADRRQKSHAEQAIEKLSEYRTVYGNSNFMMEAITAAGRRADVDEALRELKGVGLHEREEELQEAVRRVHRVLRTDLAIRIRGNISEMMRRFDELNAELRRRPFSSNQIYQFRYDRKSEYSEFLRFIDNVDEHAIADIDGLFDEHSGIGDRIEGLLAEGGDDNLADYREYFTYDIEIRDEEAGIRERLSKRIGAASGGEHKTPFYVAMGASLASAYRIESRQQDGGVDGGMSLYLADEAFEKMDSLNTIQAANYLKSIGLQLFIAAPDDAEARLRQIVDTVLFFIRDGDKAFVEPDYVTPKARKLLGAVGAPDPASSGQSRTLADV